MVESKHKLKAVKNPTDEAQRIMNRLVVNRSDRWVAAVEVYCQEKGITYDVGSDSFFRGRDENLSYADVALKARTDMMIGPHKLTKDLSIRTVSELATKQRAQAKAALIDKIITPARCDDSELRRWLSAMVPADYPEFKYENAVCVMKQWIWLVQRHIMSQSVEWHIMPIFWGPQGCGKSYNIERILEPLKSFHRKETFRVFNREFDAKPMHWNYVLFLDEMAGVRNAEAEKLKAVLSSDTIPGRNMHSDSGRALKRNANFIAATNDIPPHGLADTTGNRRFHSIQCRAGIVDGERKAFFKSIDPLKIWGCVSYESETAPIKERLAEIQSEQTDYAAEDPFKTYLDNCITPGQPDQEVYLAEIHRDYSDYCRNRSIRTRIPYQKELIQLLEGYLKVKVVNTGNRLRIRGFTSVNY